MVQNMSAENEKESKYKRKLLFHEIKNINEITPTTGRCCIICSIIDMDDNRILVSDGTGTMWVNVPDHLMSKVELNTINRILGTVQRFSTDVLEINAKIIHPLDNVDIELLRKIRRLQASINWETSPGEQSS